MVRILSAMVLSMLLGACGYDRVDYDLLELVKEEYVKDVKGELVSCGPISRADGQRCDVRLTNGNVISFRCYPTYCLSVL